VSKWRKDWIKRAVPEIKDAMPKVCGETYDKLKALLAEYEAHRAEKRGEKDMDHSHDADRYLDIPIQGESPKDAPLSDEYLSLWVPRMEEIVKSSVRLACRGRTEWICDGNCPGNGGICRGKCQESATIFLARPDVLAWKERQKAKQEPSVVYHVYKQEGHFYLEMSFNNIGGEISGATIPIDICGMEKALATAAEIDAVRRP